MRTVQTATSALVMLAALAACARGAGLDDAGRYQAAGIEKSLSGAARIPATERLRIVVLAIGEQVDQVLLDDVTPTFRLPDLRVHSVGALVDSGRIVVFFDDCDSANGSASASKSSLAGPRRSRPPSRRRPPRTSGRSC